MSTTRRRRTPLTPQELADAEWLHVATCAVTTLAATRKPFTVRDVARYLGDREPRLPSLWGLLMGRAHRAGVIEAHDDGALPLDGREVTTWRGTAWARRR